MAECTGQPGAQSGPARDIKAYWKEIAERPDWKDYILPRTDALDFEVEGMIEAQRLFHFFDGESTVIDYGCGIGRVIQYIAQKAKRAIGLDITQSFLRKARAAIPNAEFYATDDYEEEGIADLVYCFMVMQHNDQAGRERIMEHIGHLLKMGGTAIVSFPSDKSTYYKENKNLHKFTRDEVRWFGQKFDSRIVEGNLAGYAKPASGMNEYFLISVKC